MVVNGMKMNAKKTKLFQVGNTENMEVFVKGGRFEQVKQYSYLGQWFPIGGPRTPGGPRTVPRGSATATKIRKNIQHEKLETHVDRRENLY